jgi:3-deoxy-D-arabino-heptulosonate 7-phosphate (DAHP) synthase
MLSVPVARVIIHGKIPHIVVNGEITRAAHVRIDARSTGAVRDTGTPGAAAAAVILRGGRDTRNGKRAKRDSSRQTQKNFPHDMYSSPRSPWIKGLMRR